MNITIRPYAHGDSEHVAEVFTAAVHQTAAADYSPAQRAAWAPRPFDAEKWARRCDTKRPFIALTDGGKITGFMELDDDGHIDCAYVHPTFARRGVASALLRHVTGIVTARGGDRLYAEVSITARPFFAHHGFVALTDNVIDVGGVALTNTNMEKRLGRDAEPLT